MQALEVKCCVPRWMLTWAHLGVLETADRANCRNHAKGAVDERMSLMMQVAAGMCAPCHDFSPLPVLPQRRTLGSGVQYLPGPLHIRFRRDRHSVLEIAFNWPVAENVWAASMGRSQFAARELCLALGSHAYTIPNTAGELVTIRYCRYLSQEFPICSFTARQWGA